MKEPRVNKFHYFIKLSFKVLGITQCRVKANTGILWRSLSRFHGHRDRVDEFK